MNDVITIEKKVVQVVTIGMQGPQGIQGVPGTGVTDFKTNINLNGTKNGINISFTFPEALLVNSESVYLNGVKQKRGTDYTISGVNVTMVTIIPVAEDTLDATYFKL